MSIEQDVELTWLGKHECPSLEPHILLEDKGLSYGDTDSENLLIHGDNLLALKALEQEYAGQVKCIYIDPPYNTGVAFEHYNDRLEHSTWLSFMKDRLTILKSILHKEGVIFVQIDDCEMAYLKVLMDEIFGRANHLNTISMTTNYPSGFKATGATVFSTVNFLLVYAKDRTQKPLNKIYIPKRYDTGYNKYLLNPDDHYESWTWCGIADAFAKANCYKDAKEAKKKLPDTFDDELAQFAIDNAERVFQLVAIGGGAKIKRKETIEKSKKDRDKVYVHPNEDVEGFYIANGRQMVFYSNRLLEIDGEMQPAELITDVWTDISWNGIANEGGVSFKNGKKPEALLKRIFEMCTQEGDLVLDSFGGSGTTGAVAHKMGRRWIMIELGEQCHTHIIPRLQKVIDGEDQSGISKSIGWQGGGGFHYFNLVPSEEIIKLVDEAVDMDSAL